MKRTITIVLEFDKSQFKNLSAYHDQLDCVLATVGYQIRKGFGNDIAYDHKNNHIGTWEYKKSEGA